MSWKGFFAAVIITIVTAGTVLLGLLILTGA